jgi:hypothetical protein
MLADQTRDEWISVHTIEHEQFLEDPSALSEEFGGFPMRRTWEGACANPGVDHSRATTNYQQLADEFTSDRLEWIRQQVQHQISEEYDRRQGLRRSLRQRGLRRLLSFNYF